MDNWNKIFKPIVVLACICIVVTTALALTNQATAPIIAELAEEKASLAREELMPGVSFSKVECSAPNVTDAYVSEDGAAIITATSKGYGGTMVVMVAFEGNGTIVNVKVQSDGETPGIGDKATKSDTHLEQYQDLEANTLTLDVDVDRVSGATISSKAVNDAVNSTIVAFTGLS